jgi:hypothetical protein
MPRKVAKIGTNRWFIACVRKIFPARQPIALHDRRLHRWCWYRISSKSFGQDDAASRHIAEEKGGQNGQENEIPGLTRSACQKSS